MDSTTELERFSTYFSALFAKSSNTFESLLKNKPKFVPKQKLIAKQLAHDMAFSILKNYEYDRTTFLQENLLRLILQRNWYKKNLLNI